MNFRSFVLLVVSAQSLSGQTADTLRLADLQRAAVTRDPREAQRAILRDQSALRIDNIRAERFPTLGINSQAQHQSDITSVPFPGAKPPFKDTYDASLSARLRLLDPSRAPRTSVERAQLSEGDARVGATLFAQRIAVNDAFFAALQLERQHAVIAVAIADLQSQLTLARQRVSAGAQLPGDAAMIEAELLRRQQSMDEVATGHRAALATLGDLTGRTIAEGVTLALPPEQTGTFSPAALDSIRRRPEYAVYAATRDVASAREAALSAQARPRLSVFGRTGYGRPGLNQLARAFDEYWLAGVQLEWAPFDWGAAKREREVLALQRKVVATEELAFTDRLRRSVIVDAATIDRLQRTLATDDTIVALRERVLREVRLRFSEGVVTAAELVDRDSELQTARLAKATHHVELAQARVRLLTTLGIEAR